MVCLFVKKMCHFKKHPKKLSQCEVMMSWSRFFYTRKEWNEDSGFIQFSREGSSREHFLHISGCQGGSLSSCWQSWDHIWGGRQIISESQRVYLCVWGRTLLFYYFYIIWKFTTSAICPCCQMERSDWWYGAWSKKEKRKKENLKICPVKLCFWF